MKLFEKLKRVIGFTLAEVLIVVSIISVLTGIAVPSIISYRRSLHLTTLDDNARTIFMAAQNRMTALINAGDMGKLNGLELQGIPADYEGNADLGLYYLINDESGDMAVLLPGGSIESELQQGYYVVEYNLETGTVYGVFYADGEEDFEYDKYLDSESNTRTREWRLANTPNVGYYGGTVAERPAVGQMPLPEIRLINAEELVLEIDVPESDVLEGGQILLDVTMANADGTGEPITLIEKGKPYPGSHGRIALDTVTVNGSYYNTYNPPETEVSGNNWSIGASFNDWLIKKDVGHKSCIRAGDNIVLTVKLYYNTAYSGEGALQNTNLLPQIVRVSGNSLFAKVDIDKGANDHFDVINDDTVTAYIAYGRHLENLDHNVSGIDHGNIQAIQIKTIDFAAKAEEDEADPLEYWAETYVDSEGKVKTFHPIDYDRLVSYDGKNLPIRNLHVVETAVNDQGGLFGNYGYEAPNAVYAYNEGRNELKNIVLINANISATGSGCSAGALVGEGVNLDISGCQVYLEPVDGAYPTDVKVSGTTAVGGLMGYNKGCIIEDSFASTVVEATNGYAGGLIGQVLLTDYSSTDGNGQPIHVLIDTTTIQNSYAASRVTGSGGVGGLIGIVTNPAIKMTMTDCYAAGTLGGNVTPAGLFNFNGENPTYTVSNCYVAARYAETVKTAVGTFKNDKNNDYIPQAGVKYTDGNETTAAKLMTKFDTGDVWYVGNPNPKYAVFPYNLDSTNEEDLLVPPYPYPLLQKKLVDDSKDIMVHHGDWVIESVEREYTAQELDYFLVYYEKYNETVGANLADKAYTIENGKKYYWGFYSVNGADSTTAINTLLMPTEGHAEQNPDNALYAVEDGYAIIYHDDQQHFSAITRTDEGGGTGELIKFDEHTEIFGSQYFEGFVYPLPDEIINFKIGSAWNHVTNNSKYYQDAFYEIVAISNEDIQISDYYEGTDTSYNGAMNRLKQKFDDHCIARYLFNSYLACEAVNLYVKNGYDETPVGSVGNKTNTNRTAIYKPGMGEYSDQYLIRTARQLAGLSELMRTGVLSNEFIKRNYHQQLDIDFAAYERAIFGGDGRDGKTAQTPMQPLRLEGDRAGYYGHEFIIRNLYLSPRTGSNDTGLFDTITENVLSGVRLVNVHVAGGSGYTGALVGKMTSQPATVVNCGVYAETAEDYENSIVSGSGTVGGLVGYVESSIDPGHGGILSSFASVRVQGGSYAGGLVGENNGAKIVSSYVGGYTKYKGTYVTPANIVGNVAGGFIGRISNTNSKLLGVNYTTASVSGTSAAGKIAGSGTTSFNADASLYPNSQLYALGEVLSNNQRTNEADAYKRDGNQLMKTEPPLAEGYTVNARPYCTKLPNTYPYLTGYIYYKEGIVFKSSVGTDTRRNSRQTMHHGDWPVDGAIRYGVFYWEQEGDSTYNIYINGRKFTDETDTAGNPVVIDLLCDDSDGKQIKASGYGYFAEDGVTITSKTDMTAYTNVNATVAADLKTAIGNALGGSYNCTAYMSTVVTDDRNGQTDTIWTLTFGSDDFSVFINMNFAAAIEEKSNSNASTMGTVTNPYKVRSYDQLANIKGDYLAKNFIQTHDVNAAGYAAFAPIGGQVVNDQIMAFTGSYDGNDYRLIDLKIESSDRFVGLFGVTNNAVLSKITLFSTVKNEKASGQIISTFKTDGQTFGMGGLVGVAIGGSITNSVVANYDIISQVETKAGGAMGGLVGWGNVTISNSSAVVNLINEAKQGSDNPVRMGGLMGSGKAEIKNSYSGGLIKGKDTNSVEYMAGIVADDNLDNLNLTLDATSTVNNPKVENGYTYCEFDIHGSADTNKLFHVANEQQYTVTNGYFAIHNSNIGNVKFADGAETPDGYVAADIQFVRPEEENELKTFGNNFKTYAQLGSLNDFNQAAVTYKTSAVAEANDVEHKYPFRTLVTRKGGNTHYGAWPEKDVLMAANPYVAASGSGTGSPGSLGDFVLCEVYVNYSPDNMYYFAPRIWVGNIDGDFQSAVAPDGYAKWGVAFLYNPNVVQSVVAYRSDWGNNAVGAGGESKEYKNKEFLNGYTVNLYSSNVDYPLNSSIKIVITYKDGKTVTIDPNTKPGAVTLANILMEDAPSISLNDMDSVSEASPSLSDMGVETKSDEPIADSEESKPDDLVLPTDSVDLFVEPEKPKTDEVIAEEEESDPDGLDDEEEAVDLLVEDEDHRPIAEDEDS